MKKDKYKNLIFAYTVLYTFVTVLNSILYLYNGIYEDPSGNWHRNRQSNHSFNRCSGICSCYRADYKKPMVLKICSFVHTDSFACIFMYGLRALEKI